MNRRRDDGDGIEVLCGRTDAPPLAEAAEPDQRIRIALALYGGVKKTAEGERIAATEGKREADAAAAGAAGAAAPERRRIVRSPAGKPSFAVGGPHFSVSHSGPHWACCFAGENVGLDIQERREVDAVRLAERFFTPAEAACCRRGGVEMFYRIWVRKEALVKYADCTLARLLGRAQVADESGVKDRVFWHGEVVALREFRLGETIIGAVAAKEIKQLCLREMSGRKQI